MASWTEAELRMRACWLLRSYRHWASEDLLGLAPGFATSRTAEPAARDDRRAALARADEAGLLRGYSGVRVSTAGRRFEIHEGRIWTVLDDDGRRVGQAAAFRSSPV
jgi:hypothetical protein